MDVSTAMADFGTKDALADADGIVITDSAAENAGKRVLWGKVKELLGKLYVPLTRKINTKALSSDITLSAADVGAAAASHTHALDDLTGILSVNKGGTGQSSLEALLAALKQAGAVQIATGSYVGTGTYGADHPCSLTFDFSPRYLYVNKTNTNWGFHLCIIDDCGFFYRTANTGTAYPIETVRPANNTIGWYSGSTEGQMNAADSVYTYIAIG